MLWADDTVEGNSVFDDNTKFGPKISDHLAKFTLLIQ